MHYFLIVWVSLFINLPVFAMDAPETLSFPAPITALRSLSAFEMRDTAYSQNELEKTLLPVCQPTARDLLKKFLDVLHKDDFPDPKHPIAALIAGWNCLYEKLVKNNTNEPGQLKAIQQLMFLHKNYLPLDLQAEIPPTLKACSRCVGLIPTSPLSPASVKDGGSA
jgi:hypothetical protein